MSLAAGLYLRTYLAPLEHVLGRADVTDIYINRPGEVWVETLGGEIERHDDPALDRQTLDRLARLVASASFQGVNRESPLLSASLPDGSRIQVILPPATRGEIALAIRKHVVADLSLDDYASSGAFAAVSVGPSGATNSTLAEMLDKGDVGRALKAAVTSRTNILVSGGTSTGKTTFLNALIREIPQHERLIVIEDTPEVQLAHDNAIGLLAVRGALGEAQVSADDLVSASLRMRPDRIILGELRGQEAFSFLRAVNTGHPGSMSTIHADSVDGAVEQLALLVLQSGSRLSRQDVRDYVRGTVGLFVHLSRSGGRRLVSEIRASMRPGTAAAL